MPAGEKSRRIAILMFVVSAALMLLALLFLLITVSETFGPLFLLGGIILLFVLLLIIVQMRQLVRQASELIEYDVKGLREDGALEHWWQQWKQIVHLCLDEKTDKLAAIALSRLQQVVSSIRGNSVQESIVAFTWIVSSVLTVILVIFVLTPCLYQLFGDLSEQSGIILLLESSIIIFLWILPLFLPAAIAWRVQRLMNRRREQWRERNTDVNIALKAEQVVRLGAQMAQVPKQAENKAERRTGDSHRRKPKLKISGRPVFRKAVERVLQELDSKAPHRYDEIIEVLPNIDLSDPEVARITHNFALTRDMLLLYIFLRKAGYLVKQSKDRAQIIIPANQYAHEVLRELGYDPFYIEQMIITAELSRFT